MNSTTQRQFIIKKLQEAAKPTSFVSPISLSPWTAYAEEMPKVEPTESRAKKLNAFLVSKGSPLANYADYIVKLSDENDIPWTLSVSISGKESSFGKVIKPGSNNAWGIMSWDSEGTRSIKMFPSWEVGIKAHIELLGNNYKRDMNAGIQRRYCPSEECSETWVSDVTRFAKEINK